MIDFVFSRGMLGFIISCIVLGIVIGLYKIIVWETRIGIWGKVINQEEKEKFPDPSNPGEFYKFRMDMKSIKRFNKLEFMVGVNSFIVLTLL